MVPRSPSNSPPRQRKEDDFDEPEEQLLSINYGPCPFPVKRRTLIAKKPLKIEGEEPEMKTITVQEKEEGEI